MVRASIHSVRNNRDVIQMTRIRRHFAIASILMLALLCGAEGPGFLLTGGNFTIYAAGQQPPPQQEDEFVPAKDLANQEQLPAAPLVMGAYAVAWIAVFLYLWSIWRRLSRVEGEIASLSRRVADSSCPGAHH